jgi:hypothetical protein
MLMNLKSLTVLTAAAALLPATLHAAPLGYAGGTYTQDFDGLPTVASGINSTTLSGKGPHNINGVLGSTGLEGWTMGNPGGSSSSTEFKVHDGSFASSTGRGVVSFGTNGSTDRALGQLPTSNQRPAVGVTFRNDTGGVLTEFDVSYWGEQWRRGNSAANTLFFSYSLTQQNINSNTGFTNVPTLHFVTPNMQSSPTEVPLDGNAPGNRTFLSDTISDIEWEPGQLLTLRWRINELSGQDNGMAIDDVSFTAIPEPGSLILLGLGGLAMLARRRKQAVV